MREQGSAARLVGGGERGTALVGLPIVNHSSRRNSRAVAEGRGRAPSISTVPGFSFAPLSSLRREGGEHGFAVQAVVALRHLIHSALYQRSAQVLSYLLERVRQDKSQEPHIRLSLSVGAFDEKQPTMRGPVCRPLFQSIRYTQ